MWAIIKAVMLVALMTSLTSLIIIKKILLRFGVDASQYEGWFYESAGIYRHVWLNEYNNTHIATDGVFVFTDVKSNNTTVNIQSTIQNQNFNTCIIVLLHHTSQICDGNIVGKATPQSINITSNNISTITQKINITNPKLWGVDEPYLYRAVVLVKDKNNTIDSIKTRFGIRTINITDSRLICEWKGL